MRVATRGVPDGIEMQAQLQFAEDYSSVMMPQILDMSLHRNQHLKIPFILMQMAHGRRLDLLWENLIPKQQLCIINDIGRWIRTKNGKVYHGAVVIGGDHIVDWAESGD